MKTVLFARHAKSNWDQQGVNDFDRPLNEKGLIDSPKMAFYLQQCGYVIHKIISSDAVRALQTANEYKKCLTPEDEIINNHDLYLATDVDISTIIKNTPDKYSTIMIVGHNPGMTEVANFYSNEPINDMPTCSIAIIQFEVNHWSDLKASEGDLLVFESPAILESHN